MEPLHQGPPNLGHLSNQDVSYSSEGVHNGEVLLFVYMCMQECACDYECTCVCVCVFVGSHLATKDFISNLLVTEGVGHHKVGG